MPDKFINITDHLAFAVDPRGAFLLFKSVEEDTEDTLDGADRAAAHCVCGGRHIEIAPGRLYNADAVIGGAGAKRVVDAPGTWIRGGYVRATHGSSFKDRQPRYTIDQYAIDDVTLFLQADGFGPFLGRRSFVEYRCRQWRAHSCHLATGLSKSPPGRRYRPHRLAPQMTVSALGAWRYNWTLRAHAYLSQRASAEFLAVDKTPGRNRTDVSVHCPEVCP